MKLRLASARKLLALAILVASLAVAAFPGDASAQELRTKNVVLVTADGLRWQELFRGLDPIVLEDKGKSGVENIAFLRRDYGSSDPAESRRKIFPFFWGTLVGEGVVLGNRDKGSAVSVSNAIRVSYPGYAEIVNGWAQPEIVGNTPVRNFSPTVLEFAKSELGLPFNGVALYGSWTVFNVIGSKEKGAFCVNAGYAMVPDESRTPAMEEWERIQFDMRTPWDGVRHDLVTLELALEHLRAHRPRLLYIALGETDDWAHNRRYDRVIQTARFFDDALRRIWETVQSLDGYKDATSLVVTTDHGRGVTPDDWTSHGRDIPRAEEMWMAVFGPDTPKVGEAGPAPDRVQGQAAATVAKFLGLDYAKFAPLALPPLEEAFPK